MPTNEVELINELREKACVQDRDTSALMTRAARAVERLELRVRELELQQKLAPVAQEGDAEWLSAMGALADRGMTHVSAADVQREVARRRSGAASVIKVRIEADVGHAMSEIEIERVKSAAAELAGQLQRLGAGA